MQESVLFGLSLSFFFSPQESIPHEEECVGVVRMNDFQAVRMLRPHVLLQKVVIADDWCQQWLWLNSAENNLSPSVPQSTRYSATFQVLWLKSEEALIPLAWY